MSFKRPTEVSWDSDEDDELLNFNTKFKADDDEELDEDALLGSDDEDEFSQSSVLSNKKSHAATAHKTTIQATNNRTLITGPSKASDSAGNRNANNNNFRKEGGNVAKTRQITPKSTGKQSKKIVPIEMNEPEPVLLLDPEESYDFDESGVSETILDSSQGEEPEDQFIKPQPVTSRAQTQEAPVRERMTEEEDQSDVSTMEVSVDQGQESSEESDDSDNEHGRRRRFKTERQGSIKLSTHKAADIPDTLEISKEQEKEIEQFLHHGPNKNKSYRGRGRGNFSNMRGQQRMGLNQGQRSGPPANQNTNHHFSQEAQANQSHHQGAVPPVSKPQKIHINPHFRRAGMLPPRQGDGIMPSPAVPPLFRPQGPPSLLHIQPSAPIMHSAPQSVPWTSQANPQPMYSKPNPQHQVPHPQQHFPSQQPQPRHGVPYSDFSRGPPSYPPQGQQVMRPPHIPHSRPAFHGQEFHQQNQFPPHRPPAPQPLLPQGHQFSQHPQHPQHPQPLMRSEPQHQHHGQMGPPQPQHTQNRPPLHHRPQMQHPQFGQQFSQQRFPTPGHSLESHVRPNFNHHQQQQQQQQPSFQQMGQGFQNRPQRFQSQGERMHHSLNNNAVPQHPVMKPKQNAVLHAHAKKLKERAKKFGQTPQMGPSRPTKPPKRPSTEAPSTDSSPVKQSKVETEVLTPEDKELQEKLAMQAKQREMIRQRKEANRQAMAQKKREQLAQRLAGKGQTLEDIDQPAAGNAQSNKPVNVNTAPKKTLPTSLPLSSGGQQIQTIHSNLNQNPQRKVVNPNVSGNKPASQVSAKPATTNNNKKLMRRIETVKKNAQGEIISREIKLVPIEDEASAGQTTSVLNQGRVQVVKKSIPVTAVGGNRSVISPSKSAEAGNRAVIRIGATDNEDSEDGDRRNVVSQQPTGRRIVLTSKTKNVMVKNLSVSTSDLVIKNLCTTVGPVETMERKEKDAVITFKDGKHAALFAEKYNRSLLDLSTILVSLVHY